MTRQALIAPLALLAMLALAACASSTPRGETRQTDVRVATQVDDAARNIVIQNESSVSSYTLKFPVARVWRALQEVYQELELPVSEFDPDRKRMGHEGFAATRIDGERMSRYMDCGLGMTGPNADRFDIRVTLYTTLNSFGEDTELIIDVDGQGKPREYSGNWMHCGSQGELETLIVERLAARLADPGQR